MQIRSNAVGINQFLLNDATEWIYQTKSLWKCWISWISPRKEVSHLEEL